MNSPSLFCKKIATNFIDQTMDKLFPISNTNNHQHHLSLFWYYKTIAEIKLMQLILLRKLNNLINSFPGWKTLWMAEEKNQSSSTHTYHQQHFKFLLFASRLHCVLDFTNSYTEMNMWNITVTIFFLVNSWITLKKELNNIIFVANKQSSMQQYYYGTV